MKLVLDTNIVVSAFINPQGIPSRIMWIVLNRKAELIYNSVILSEYESVMLRPKFSSKINPGAIRQFIDLIRSIATLHQLFFDDIEIYQHRQNLLDSDLHYLAHNLW